MQQLALPLKGEAEMGRQRTINDQNFWHSTKLFNCTTEDKVGLLHLLTGPVSNIIGVYSILPRIAGAEIGWTADQWLQVVGRLQEAGLAKFNREKMVVWVCVWWEHHNASQVTGPKLRERTKREMLSIPEEWREDFCIDFKARLSGEQQEWVKRVMHGDDIDTPAIPYADGIDTVPVNVRDNTYNQPKQIKETTTLGGSASSFDVSKVPRNHQIDVYNAIVAARDNGTIAHPAQVVVDAMVERFASATSPPKCVFALTTNLATRHQLNT